MKEQFSREYHVVCKMGQQTTQAKKFIFAIIAAVFPVGILRHFTIFKPCRLSR